MNGGELASGCVLDGRYRIEGLLGSGGMGSVYAARHVVVGRKVAVKLLHTEYASNAEAVSRFYREAQAAAAIGHRNIIEVFDVGMASTGSPYLVMEYLEGESLGALLARTGPLDLATACGIIEPVLLALSAAHAKGIIHRDLKPENIFLAHREDEPPEVKLIDFGVSKFGVGTGKSQLTRTGSLLGTPAYMSPEQARGESPIDARSDVYAVGVILYQMLTGALPFTGDNYNVLLINLLTSPPRSPYDANPAFPAEAEPLVLSALSKRPDERPKSARDFLERLKGTSEFTAGRERLAHVASGIVHRGYASGDLGPTPGSGDALTTDVVRLGSAVGGTPGVWSSIPPPPKKYQRVVAGAIAVVISIGALVAVIAVVQLGGDKKVIPAPAPGAAHKAQPAAAHVDGTATSASVAEPAEAGAPPDPVEDRVLVTVVGAPKGARITYADKPYSTKEFRVDRGEKATGLRVEADGYEPFEIAVIPSKDVKVDVRMSRLEPKTDKHRKKKTVDDAKPASVPSPSSEPTGAKLKEGKRGIKYGNDFE